MTYGITVYGRRYKIPGGGKKKIPDSAVPVIRESREKIAVLAARYGVTEQTIGDIRNGRSRLNL